MQPNDYVKNVLVTESNNFDVIGSRFTVWPNDFEAANTANPNAIRNIRLLHATLGISTEVGELFEFYDSENLDFTNLKEEVGDAFWYCGIAVDELKLDLAKMIEVGRARMNIPQELSLETKRACFLQVLITATKDANILLDLMKKSAFYGKALDQVKFADTLARFVGSMLAALAIGGFTVEDAMEVNIAKLKKRYGDKFTEAAANTRNLAAERKILEGDYSII